MRPGPALCAFLLCSCGESAPQGFVVVVSGRVVDETGRGIGGATITLGSSAPVDTGAEVVGITQADPGGDWSVPVYGAALEGNVLRALYDAPGRTQAWARYVLNLRSPTVSKLDPGPLQTWETTSRSLPAMELSEEAAVARADVQVVTLLGDPVPGAHVELRRGWNAAVGDPVEVVATTGSDGGFVLDAVPGWWTATVDAGATWGEARFGVYVNAAATRSVTGVVPSLDPVWLTAALTWASPPDLDLHLIAPQKGTNGATEYHVWAGAPRHPENDIADAEAELLRADNDGIGPESLVVASKPDDGETRLNALDNTDLGDPNATALGLGHAQLQLWIDGEEPAWYTGSPGEVATLWRPVEIEGGVQYQVETWAEGTQPDDAEQF